MQSDTLSAPPAEAPTPRGLKAAGGIAALVAVGIVAAGTLSSIGHDATEAQHLVGRTVDSRSSI